MNSHAGMCEHVSWQISKKYYINVHGNKILAVNEKTNL